MIAFRDITIQDKDTVAGTRIRIYPGNSAGHRGNTPDAVTLSRAS